VALVAPRWIRRARARGGQARRIEPGRGGLVLFWHDPFPSAVALINRIEALTEQNATGAGIASAP